MQRTAASGGAVVLLTETGFKRLLESLDPDRETAGQKYERIQRKLVWFFEWRGCTAAEELADKTMDRVTRRLIEGEEIRAKDPSVYFYAVARNIAHEWWNAQKQSAQFLEPFASNFGVSNQVDDAEERLGCLDQCLEKLAPEARYLILEYYEAGGQQKIENRRRLAVELQISSSALRLRAQRIREQLEKCVRRRLKHLEP
jgi:DNA-directed RNA polymerase specialized sigma24 family protein